MNYWVFYRDLERLTNTTLVVGNGQHKRSQPKVLPIMQFALNVSHFFKSFPDQGAIWKYAKFQLVLTLECFITFLFFKIYIYISSKFPGILQKQRNTGMMISDYLFLTLTVSLPLIWHILDEILAKQGLEDIIQISQFVKLAFSLRQKCVKTFLYAYTPRHISETERHKPKRKIYLLSGFILKKTWILT
jgi:hypothetical protein